MKRFIRLYWPEVMLLSCAAWLILILSGCGRMTAAQEKAARAAGGIAAPFFGLPPGAGTALVDTALAIAAFFAGHKHGRHKERQKNPQKADTVLTKAIQ